MRSSFPLIALSLLTLASGASAQSAPEANSWDDGAILQPASGTARAITGPISIGETFISFDGKRIPAKSEGRFWRHWGDGPEKSTATILRLEKDPGVLRQGNTLCADKAKFVVLWENYGVAGHSLRADIWSSSSIPFDRNSPGLCATYSYSPEP